MGRRFTAKLVDLSITLATAVVPTFLYASCTEGAPEGAAPVLATIAHLLVPVFAVFFHDPVFTALGGTVGKRLCGLRVARLETGQPVGFGVALGRHLTAFFINGMTCLPPAHLWCTWDKPHHQGLHDKILRTVVVLRQGAPKDGWRESWPSSALVGDHPVGRGRGRPGPVPGGTDGVHGLPGGAIAASVPGR